MRQRESDRLSNQRSLGFSDKLILFLEALLKLLSSLPIHGIMSVELAHCLVVFFEVKLTGLSSSDGHLPLVLSILMLPLLALDLPLD